MYDFQVTVNSLLTVRLILVCPRCGTFIIVYTLVVYLSRPTCLDVLSGVCICTILSEGTYFICNMTLITYTRDKYT